MEDERHAALGLKRHGIFPASMPSFRDIECQENLRIIIETAEENKAFQERCYDPRLIEFWNSIFGNGERHQLLTSILRYNIPSFIPQKGIHPFDFICGIYYFDIGFQALCSKEMETAERLFLKGETCQYFQAVLQLNQFDIATIHDLTRRAIQAQEDTFSCICERVSNIIPIYGTPAYIMFAMTMLYIAEYNQHVLKNPKATSAAYQLLIQHLETARLLEPHCQAGIHNAYLGKGIPASNPYGCTTIRALIEKAVWFAGACLDDMSISVAKNHARLEAQKFLQGRGIASSETNALREVTNTAPGVRS